MFDCTKDRSPTAHLVQPATGMGGQVASLILTRTNIIADICFLSNFFSKGISCILTRSDQRSEEIKRTRFLAFDIVHAVEFSRIGRSWCFVSRLRCQGNFSCLSPSLSRRATCLTYHLRSPCQIDRSELKSARQIVVTFTRGGLFILRSEDSFLQEVHCYLTRILSLLRPESSATFPHLWGDK
jgi:hypothetical protein